VAAGGTEGSVSPLLIRLFGPLEVRRDGEPLPPLRTRKGLWLLALLTLHHGCPLDREWLASTLWPDSPQSQALYNLRRSLSDLRRVLGTQAYRLRATPFQCLCLDLTGAEVDLFAFDELLARQDEPALETAVGLYQGPLLEGCAEEWAVQERERREQSYLAALEVLATRATARSDHASAARFLRQAIATDPYRETAHRALMEALAAGGDAAAALLVYRELCLLLHREVNTKPSLETQALFERLRSEVRQRALRGGSRSETPGLQVADDRQPSNLGPATGPRGNLPQPLSAFIGREKECREVRACLSSARLLTLTGTGGIGKTRLALRIADECAGEYADGAWFVNLAALADAALVPQVVAHALRVPEAPGCPLMETLQDALGVRQLLLVLDNCEHLIDACARLADTLLSRCPHLRILATSRQALRLTGETVWPVSPLSLPEPGARETERRTPEALMEFEAIHLFVERAAAASSGFALGESNASATAEVCRRLDGIPLAIELAAARLRALPIEQIAARLDDRFRLLTGGSRAALPRQQTLRATLDWSYDLLSEPERILLRRLSVFAGGWTLEAAEAVCADDQGPTTNDQREGADVGRSSWVLGRDEILDLLASLVEKSLVVYEEPGTHAAGYPRSGSRCAGARHRLLETVRQYFSERLLESGEGDATRGRHLDYFLALAEAAEPQLTGAQQVEWLERLETEHDNLRAALAFSRSDVGLRMSDLPSSEMGLRLAGALWRFWSVRGYLTEGRDRLAQALASAPEASASRAKALEKAGSLAYRQADYRAARSLQEESLAIRRELGDRAGIAASLRNLGLVAYSQGDYGVARALQEESLAIGRELGNRRGIAASLNCLGVLIAHQQGDYGAARLLYEASLAIRRELGDRVGIADSLRNLGSVAYQQGDYGAARSLFEESLQVRRELGDRLGIAGSLHDLGLVAYQQGDYGVARSLFEESLQVRRELGDRLGIAGSLHNLGLVAYSQGDYGVARSLYEESLAIRRELGDRGGIAAPLEALAALACEGQGQPGAGEVAAHLFGAAAALREAIGAPVPPSEQEAHNRQLRLAREMLGEEAFAAAWAEGRAMSLEDAVAFALSETRRR
jgi:predicted ATPase/DNA-binding SARP family transcriptional activator